MSKSSYKHGLNRNKVFLIPMGTDKNGRVSAYRINKKNGKTICIAKNGLSV